MYKSCPVILFVSTSLLGLCVHVIKLWCFSSPIKKKKNILFLLMWLLAQLPHWSSLLSPCNWLFHLGHNSWVFPMFTLSQYPQSLSYNLYFSNSKNVYLFSPDHSFDLQIPLTNYLLSMSLHMSKGHLKVDKAKLNHWFLSPPDSSSSSGLPQYVALPSTYSNCL